MKRKFDELLDGITPDEMKMIEDKIENEKVPDNVDTDRIAELVSEKTGLKIAEETEKNTKERAKILYIRARRVLIAAAALALVAAMMAGIVINTKLGNDTGSNVYADGVIGGRSDGDSYRADVMGDAEAVEEAEGIEIAADGKVYYGVSGGEDLYIEIPEEVVDITGATASTITAREYCDLDYISDFKAVLSSSAWKDAIGKRSIYAGNIITVSVTDGNNPVYNTKVVLLEDGAAAFSSCTDINGRAYLFYDIKNIGRHGSLKVKVGEKEYDVPENNELNVTVSDAGLKITDIDLMLMVDTTGSMSDELEYIKAELEDVVSRVEKTAANVSLRISVNFYRDEGDTYVVKYYDFRDNVEDVLKLISDERASGGGDYAEAVHTALDNAVNGHTWRDNAVKLCFFVLDAPAHSESERQGVNDSLRASIVKAAELGIRIIPTVASGADTDTESLMRTAAVMTGGTYIYITSESGIGGSHKTADVDPSKENQTEFLNDCMVRLICEYSGLTQ